MQHSSPARVRSATSRPVPRAWDPEQEPDDDKNAFLSASDLAKTLQPVPRSQPPRRQLTGRENVRRPWPVMDMPLGFNDWPFDPLGDNPRPAEAYRSRNPKAPMRGAAAHLSAAFEADFEVLAADTEEAVDAARARAFQMAGEMQPRHSQAQLQRYQQQRQYQQRALQREFNGSSQIYRRQTEFESRHDHGDPYDRDASGREMESLAFDPPRRIPRTAPSPAASVSSQLAPFPLRLNGPTKDSYGRMPAGYRYNSPSPSTHSPSFGPGIPDVPLEPSVLEMYQAEVDTAPTVAGVAARRREYGARPPPRQRFQQQDARKSEFMDDDVLNDRRGLQTDLARERRGSEGRLVYQELVPPPAIEHAGGKRSAGRAINDDLLLSGSAPPSRHLTPENAQQQNAKRPRPKDPAAGTTPSPTRSIPATAGTDLKGSDATKPSDTTTNAGAASTLYDDAPEPKRRCGRKSMNYSSEQKRERNRAAVKKCRQRQALKLEYLQHKAETLTAENLALSEMLVKNTELDVEQRTSLTRGIQMDILLKIKEIFTQSLPKDFVLDADSIWDLNSVLAVSMPSRCYYGIDSIKDFWRTSLRMRNKGKIRSFWAWLFRLPPGDRFSEFDIQPFSPKSNLYFISWTTKSTPPLAGSMVIMFGNGHRVTLHVECFGWLIWRYLLSNEPFPEPSVD
ncbi:hypothetical protein PHYBOEH_000529 [Phytophthora boehmeriae]|uniref:BZIP domain-containing protein n=1 Tax=Phytophthora boehmeriae TaxID=109152 RepID=A0A8T1WVQ0_9STRA|nr:hypothetical protein PHYBOEH_000529 [Phytophthora boehmeriae]